MTLYSRTSTATIIKIFVYRTLHVINRSFMNTILFADSAGPAVQKLYHQSHYVVAGLIPATLVSEKASIPAKLSDIGLAAAIPVHSHIALNYGTFYVTFDPSFPANKDLNRIYFDCLQW
jgi:hypothetical protein